MTIGTRVRSLRQYRDWSQEDLAQKSGLQRPHISMIENNERTPGADSLIGLATALSTSTDYLLGRTDDPSPRPNVNHPALADPDFAELATLWPDVPPAVRKNLINFLRVFLRDAARLARGEPLEY